MRQLTEKQQRVLDFIQDFQEQEGMSPTVDEIAQHFKISGTSAFAHLRALQRKGHIERSSKARSLSLKRRSATPRHLSLTLSVPILGRISAGLPLLSEGAVEESVVLDPALLPTGCPKEGLFALRVNGESMRDAGIQDQDLLIARQESKPTPGDIVIALVDGETTVKSFYPDKKQIELRPANPDFSPQFYPADEVTIQGKAVAVYHTF